jgi:hypothetical protein
MTNCFSKKMPRFNGTLSWGRHMDLNGAVALVTGGNGGLGQATRHAVVYPQLVDHGAILRLSTWF